jgi:hypothetical protein
VTVPDVCARCHATDEMLAVRDGHHAAETRELREENARLRDRCVTLAETAHVAIRARLKAEGECARLRETMAARRPAWITYTDPVPTAARMMEG